MQRQKKEKRRTTMPPTISDLWYGNIHEMDACGSSPYLMRKEARLENKRQALAQTLTDEQKSLLDEFVKAVYENNSDYAEAAFAHGFSLGMRLAGEAWMPPII
jgi:hypothetical protein